MQPFPETLIAPKKRMFNVFDELIGVFYRFLVYFQRDMILQALYQLAALAALEHVHRRVENQQIILHGA